MLTVRILNDLTVDKFAAILKFLDPAPVCTASLDFRGTKAQSQKAHMIGWFMSQLTTGEKGYKRFRANTSSAATYNRLLNPGALIWIVDALGEDSAVIEKAVQAAKAAGVNDYRERCRAFRRLIPWDRVYELAANPAGWRIDPAIESLLSWRGGWPAVKPSKQAEFDRIIEKELS